MTLRLGRLRVQFWGEGWSLEAFRLAPGANPHWAWFAQCGPVTLRWSRASLDVEGGGE